MEKHISTSNRTTVDFETEQKFGSHKGLIFVTFCFHYGTYPMLHFCDPQTSLEDRMTELRSYFEHLGILQFPISLEIIARPKVPLPLEMIQYMKRHVFHMSGISPPHTYVWPIVSQWKLHFRHLFQFCDILYESPSPKWFQNEMPKEKNNEPMPKETHESMSQDANSDSDVAEEHEPSPKKFKALHGSSFQQSTLESYIDTIAPHETGEATHNEVPPN